MDGMLGFRLAAVAPFVVGATVLTIASILTVGTLDQMLNRPTSEITGSAGRPAAPRGELHVIRSITSPEPIIIRR